MSEIDPSYQLLACQYLRVQLEALVKAVWGVRANEYIEPVHQARVASRRIREGLRLFSDCFDGKRISAWRRRIRRLTRGLGAARDLDVHIDFVEKFLDGLDQSRAEARPGIERLLLRLRQRRRVAQPDVVRALDALDKDNILADMHGELEKTLFMLRSHEVQIQSPFVFRQASAHIRRRQRGLWAGEHALADPQDTKGHHQLRIDAKKLRYTMEICDAAYDGRLKPVIKAVKDLQSLLGDIHDCDVWAEEIEAFIEQERQAAIQYFGDAAPFEPLRPGLLLIRDERQAHREQAFTELLVYWNQLKQENLWGTLEVLLQSGVGSQSPRPERQKQPGDVKEEATDADHAAQ
ncbi:MAG: CHAD domain-containing protein [Sedimentisphaerales bacterium]|nr:CHAD domain-containing protein [Sedimentisphaerales bacterium]